MAWPPASLSALAASGAAKLPALAMPRGAGSGQQGADSGQRAAGGGQQAVGSREGGACSRQWLRCPWLFAVPTARLQDVQARPGSSTGAHLGSVNTWAEGKGVPQVHDTADGDLHLLKAHQGATGACCWKSAEIIPSGMEWERCPLPARLRTTSQPHARVCLHGSCSASPSWPGL